MRTIADTVVDLRKQAEQTAKLRTEAEVAARVAAQQLDTINAELKTLGVNPDLAEQEVEALEAQVATMAEKLAADLQAESESYRKVLDAARAAGVVK